MKLQESSPEIVTLKCAIGSQGFSIFFSSFIVDQIRLLTKITPNHVCMDFYTS